MRRSSKWVAGLVAAVFGLSAFAGTAAAGPVPAQKPPQTPQQGWPYQQSPYQVPPVDPSPNRPLLGITGQVAPNGIGYLVTSVLTDTPAADAGLLPGDLILTVNGRIIQSRADIQIEIDHLMTNQYQLPLELLIARGDEFQVREANLFGVEVVSRGVKTTQLRAKNLKTTKVSKDRLPAAVRSRLTTHR
jgi:membrane-associated protease RseP (regulator of RpoE activity)